MDAATGCIVDRCSVAMTGAADDAGCGGGFGSVMSAASTAWLGSICAFALC